MARDIGPSGSCPKHLMDPAWVLSAMLVLWTTPVCKAQTTAQPAAMLEGVETVAAPGSPGPLVVFGDRAFPVLTTGDGRVLVAATHWGEGRVVAFGHTGYLDEAILADKSAQTALLMGRAIRWTAPSASDPALAIAGEGRRFLTALGLPDADLVSGGWREAVDRPVGTAGRPNVLVVGSHGLARSEDRDRVARFVRTGGGLVTSGLGWGWLQLNPGRSIEDHPGSLLLRDAGLAFADGTLHKDGDRFAVRGAPDALSHAAAALAALSAADERGITSQQAERATETIRLALRTLPAAQSPMHTSLSELLHERAGAFEALYRTMHEQPLSAAGHALALLEIERFVAMEFDAPPEQVRAHPAAAAFPGAVPEHAPRTTQEVTIDSTMPGWRCTGLYAPAGELVQVEFLGSAPPPGLVVQIGAHLDPASRPPLRRLPRMVRRFAATSTSLPVASAVGGLIYFDVPKGTTASAVRARLSGVVKAPHFVLGRTTDEEWRQQLRLHPAPFGELESSQIALTVPAQLLRTLDSPAALMAKWDEIVLAQGSLEPRRTNGLGDRQARYVPDVMVSFGYMYAPADRPLTIPLSAAATLVDLDSLSTNANGDCWGLFHELGHWHQNSMWTFAGTGEVTVNLFTLYTIDKVCGIASEQARGTLFTPERMLRTMQRHHARGAPFATWQSDPFLALTMYVQVQQAFGWETYRKVFAGYRALPPAERPVDDDAKRDQWLQRLSTACGHDLGPFFEAWGVPVSEVARASVAHLPRWMPAGWRG